MAFETPERICRRGRIRRLLTHFASILRLNAALANCERRVFRQTCFSKLPKSVVPENPERNPCLAMYANPIKSSKAKLNLNKQSWEQVVKIWAYWESIKVLGGLNKFFFDFYYASQPFCLVRLCTFWRQWLLRRAWSSAVLNLPQ